MTYLTMQHIPLKAAYLCQDCNSVGNNSSCCPACASGSLLSLAGVLDREMAVEERSMTLSYPRSVAAFTSMVA
jgi:hypothetical protein